MAERISCLYIGRVGDLIVATPFLRALRRRYPKARIRLIIGWRGVQVPPLIPFIDDTVVLSKPLDLLAHLKLARSLSGKEDLLVDLNSSFSKTSTMLAQAVRAPVKLAFAKPRGPNPFTQLVAAPAEKEHIVRPLARAWPKRSPRPTTRTPSCACPTPTSRRPTACWARAPPRRASRCSSIPATSTASPSAGPRRSSSSWPTACSRTGRCISTSWAGPANTARWPTSSSRLKVSVPILPPARLGVTGAMLKRMDLFVCNITGTTHLAAALDVPTFGFYAGYTQAVWRPRGARHGGTVCPEWESCRETTVDEAYAALTAHIARLRPAF